MRFEDRIKQIENKLPFRECSTEAGYMMVIGEIGVSVKIVVDTLAKLGYAGDPIEYEQDAIWYSMTNGDGETVKFVADPWDPVIGALNISPDDLPKSAVDIIRRSAGKSQVFNDRLANGDRSVKVRGWNAEDVRRVSEKLDAAGYRYSVRSKMSTLPGQRDRIIYRIRIHK